MPFQRDERALCSLEPDPAVFDGVMDSYRRWLEAGQRTPATQRVSVTAIRLLARFLVAHALPERIELVTREHIELWLVNTRSRGLKLSSVNRYADNLRAFMRWCVDEEYLDRSPMERIRRAREDQAPPDVLTDEEIRALFKACEGKDIYARRDMAMMRLWFATGMRRGELTGLRVQDVDLHQRLITVTGKNRKTRHIRIGIRTIVILERYLKQRKTLRVAQGSDALWLGKRGAITYTGVYTILQHRATQANVRHIYPHLWRHTMAHRYLAKGGGEVNLEAHMGWENNSQMLRRYGASMIASRARDEYDRLGLDDDL
jgi:site-specific recombinase XerD